MSRKGLSIPIQGNMYAQNRDYWEYDPDGVRSNFQALRDALRSHLDDGAQTQWLVSDIFDWNGNQSYHRGMGFLVRHHDGGSWTGHEWMVFVGYADGNNDWQQLDDIIGSADTYARHDSNGTNSGNAVDVIIWYNHDGLSSSFDVNLSSDGTLLDGSDVAVGEHRPPDRANRRVSRPGTGRTGGRQHLPDELGVELYP